MGYASYALDYSTSCGPKFGSDLNIFTISNNPSAAFDTTYCNKVRYERSIRDSIANFSIEDYEVFQIIRR
uniref:TLDc domain-containing protein n=1 Tax=Rhizophagus irregularis (strain DAOM 181602 / DAOM 197198 / MUCL 43194) TaxID=747089 RepID=U9TRR2_RHIID